MDITASPSAAITCATPGCGTVTALAASGYIDGCGQVCRECFGPDPKWLDDLEPPF